MKKVLFALIALVGIISSCTNDDITISRAITFKVNPATVVDNLYERNAGDLTSLSSGAKLQVSLYIYNEKGILVNKVNTVFACEGDRHGAVFRTVSSLLVLVVNRRAHHFVHFVLTGGSRIRV